MLLADSECECDRRHGCDQSASASVTASASCDKECECECDNECDKRHGHDPRNCGGLPRTTRHGGRQAGRKEGRGKKTEGRRQKAAG